MNLSVYSSSVLGSSHAAAGMPLQDRAGAFVVPLADGSDVIVLAVSDGHGSPDHFRSHLGAGFAVDTVRECVPDFMEQLRAARPDGRFFISRGCETDDDGLDALFRKFFGEVTAAWSRRVLDHYRENPPGPDERPSPVPARPYGCTLLGAACAGDLWCAFQLGDGLALALAAEPSDMQPLPSDPRCVDNLTTSMCMHGPADFRYCCGSQVPPALMLTTDGLEKCYESGREMLSEFMLPVVDEFVKSSFETASGELSGLLPRLSAEGSHDDISLAMWIDADEAALELVRIRPDVVRHYSGQLDSIRAELDGIEQSLRCAEAEMTRLVDEEETEIRRNVVRSLQRRRTELLEEKEYLSTRISELN